MYLGLSYLIEQGEISNETVLRYLTGHPVSKVTVGMFFIGMASLALIANNVFGQFGAERKITIKPTLDTIAKRASERTESATDSDSQAQSAGEQTVELGKRLLDLPSWMHEHYLWQRLVNSLHSIYRANSTSGVEDEMKYLADLDLDRQQQRYSLVRILIWATPMLGFLGTVLGISQALGGINVGPDNNFKDMMDGLRGSLYVAFDTTALALTLSMIMMFAQFLVDRFESQLLVLVDQRAKQEIASQFDMTANREESVFGSVAQEFLNASRESIQNQTESWRDTMRSAEKAWTSSLGRVDGQVQSHLSSVLDDSVSNLASSLAAAIEKADMSMSHRWEQWQVTLSDNARSMSTYQQQLAEQTELIHQLLGQNNSQESFQPALEQTNQAVEATARLRQSLDELASKIEDLKAEPNSSSPDQSVIMPVVKSVAFARTADVVKDASLAGNETKTEGKPVAMDPIVVISSPAEVEFETGRPNTHNAGPVIFQPYLQRPQIADDSSAAKSNADVVLPVARSKSGSKHRSLKKSA